MKALPRIQDVTNESSSAIPAAQQRAQGSVIIRFRVDGTDISSARTGHMKGARTNFSSPSGSPNINAVPFFKGTSCYPKGKKRFG